MEIRILKNGKPGFQGEISSIEELKSLYHRTKQIDQELGYTFTYDIPEIKDLVKEVLSSQTDHFFYTQAKLRGGYLNMGEIVHDAGEGDPDAQFLLKLYDAIWEKEEELEKQIDSMSLEELLKIENMEAWVKPHYDQIVAELENTADSTTDNTSNTSEG